MIGRALLPVITALLITFCTTSGPWAGSTPHEYPPGEEGYALTVIGGDEIVEIPVSFVGIVRGALGPGMDLHLVELHGEVASQGGVANGMSGSPVYFRGELLGALAYRLGNMPKRAVGGVVPFTYMVESAMTSAPAAGSVQEPLSPIGTPLAMSGIDPVVGDWLASSLSEFGLIGVGGGGDDRQAVARTPLPGSHVGIELVGGDMHLAATGTVTAVEGEKVYAFGHSFMGRGSVEYPMVSAEVVHMLQDMLGSVMLANTGPVMGAVLDDRQTAVIGYLGRSAETIPVDVVLRGHRFEERMLHYDIVRNSPMTPTLFGAAVANGILNSVGHETEVTVRATGTIVLREGMVLPVDMSFTGGPGRDPLISVAAMFQRQLRALYENRFETPVIDSIEIAMDVRQGRSSYRLERLLYDRESVDAGEQIEVGCVISSFRSGEIREKITVQVPEGTVPGTRLVLVVGGADEVEAAMGKPLSGRLDSAGDLRTYLDVLSEKKPANTLRAVLLRRDDGTVVAGGGSLDSLPLSATDLLGSGKGNGAATGIRLAPVAENELELRGPVRGRSSAVFTVGRTAGGGTGR